MSRGWGQQGSMCVFGGGCSFDQGCGRGFVEMTFQQFERDVRSQLGGYLGAEHSRHQIPRQES